MSAAVASAPSSSVDSSVDLPPLVRAALDRSRLASRTTSSNGKYVTTKELKMQATQKVVKQAKEEEAKERQSEIDHALDPYDDTSSSPSRPTSGVGMYRELGSLYSTFQTVAQQAAANLVNGFPGHIRTTFERTGYWKKSPPKESQQLGPLAWLYLHYALPRVDMVQDVTTFEELHSLPYRLTWRQFLFLSTDWEMQPRFTSKARLATLYQRYGVVEGRKDMGLTYLSFIKCIAIISLEVILPPEGSSSSRHAAESAKPLMTTPKTSFSSSSSSTPSSSSRSPNARDRCLNFLNALKWTNMEYVASGLEKLQRTSWYRLRAELIDAKSVYIHKPTCLTLTRVGSNDSNTHDGLPRATLRAEPCSCATPPQWSSFEKRILEGLKDSTKVLHLNPHAHQTHGVKGKNKVTTSTASAIGKKPSVSSLQQAMSNGGGSWPPQEVQSNKPLSNTSRATDSDDDLFTLLQTQSSPTGGISSTSNVRTTILSSEEELALKVLRTFERLPLEDTWCTYPGAFIDMGVIEVLPTIGSESSSSKNTARSDPHALPVAKLRTHKYHLELKNIVNAGLKVKIDTFDCDWLSLEYKQRHFLPLGLTQRLEIRAPRYMPEDANIQRDGSGGAGEGTEKMGIIRLTVENSWTYEIAHVDIPVYARLVLRGTCPDLSAPTPPLTSLPTLKSSPTNNNNSSSRLQPDDTTDTQDGETESEGEEEEEETIE